MTIEGCSGTEDLEHLVAVDTSVEAVLVLDDRHVELVERVRQVRDGRDDPLTSSPITRRRAASGPRIDDADDADLDVVGLQPGRQRAR